MNKQAVLKLMAEKKIDLIISAHFSIPDPNLVYLSGIKKGTFEGSSLFLWKNGKRVFFTSRLEESLAKKQLNCPVITYGKTNKKASQIIKEIVGRARQIGIDKSGLGVYDFEFLKRILKGKKFLDVGKELSNIRSVKTNEEIKTISKACRISSNVAEEIPDIVKIGMTEKQVAAEMEKRMKEYGGDEIAFPTIVASGPNSAIPHSIAGDRKIRKGDFVVADFGCKIDNYCSDITRTFVIGKPSEKQIKIYNACYEAQTKCVDMVKEGAKINSICETAEEITSKHAKSIHSLGHGLGIRVHEAPGIGSYNKNLLKAGMVITIEPGVYINGFGGVRIEDDVLVTKTGCKILTKATKKLVQI